MFRQCFKGNRTQKGGYESNWTTITSVTNMSASGRFPHLLSRWIQGLLATPWKIQLFHCLKDDLQCKPKYTTGLDDEEPLNRVILKDLGVVLLMKMPHLQKHHLTKCAYWRLSKTFCFSTRNVILERERFFSTSYFIRRVEVAVFTVITLPYAKTAVILFPYWLLLQDFVMLFIVSHIC